MAIHQVNYTEGLTFDYKAPGASKSSTFNHSVSLTIGHYAQDSFGRDATPIRDAVPPNATKIRSFYTVDSDEPSMLNFPLTFEGVVQLLSTRRARTVEAEISPMAVIIQERNATLKELGIALGQISAGLTWWEEKDKHEEPWYVNKELQNILEKNFSREEMDDVYSVKADGTKPDDNWDEYELKKANALVKSQVDKLNNEAQTDMSRMESLVSKRDESFTLASDLTSTVSDGRTSIINNMGG